MSYNMSDNSQVLAIHLKKPINDNNRNDSKIIVILPFNY